MLHSLFAATLWCHATGLNCQYFSARTDNNAAVSVAAAQTKNKKLVPAKKIIKKPLLKKKAAPRQPQKQKFIQPPIQQLTMAGVIAHTNRAREVNGVTGMLQQQGQLNAAAAARLADMFQQQYFEHDSPQGVKPSQVAEKAGYDFVQFAENIAYGPFKTEAELVDAWMNSPGHRTNILNPVFTEIGVAVGRGKMLGDDVWLGVQLFGKPAAACPTPQPTLKQQIDSGNAQLATQDAEAKKISTDLDATSNPQSSEQIAAYNKKVQQYNALVDSMQKLYLTISQQHNEYNKQVDAYNGCVNT
ncbi:MAG: hypothetical protein A2848_01635 [Candidatus Magasanikbacteria bacterium RIFCSPHIGHO2_01_FULL_50_8]|uniref:SCP domain-containing protein n=2 Tax=Candidatus Magasanikiibacteriota TaxID=1752731 RepID=A0A1F6LQV9_9BACT|nr:MAG: hypothetical protein A2848_01635 [Candidatus Magasanikbacteria bacterium RIFCSPHIGHO2_01_FULL_50_8]OGH68247.1 MAG: hypothetical protein A3C15_03830 [Candidatus Magasanikbacteria bacterium RIFCSPHIGHO2_02_FULL_50_9b]